MGTKVGTLAEEIITLGSTPITPNQGMSESEVIM